MAEQFRSQLEAERAKASSESNKETQLAREINEWKQKYGELETRLGQMDLSQSREFRATYDAPLMTVKADIARALVTAGVQEVDAEQQAEDIMMSDQPESLIAKFPATLQGMILYKLKDAEALWSKRAQALDDWRTTQQGLEEVSVRDNFVASAERRAKLADVAFEKLSKIAPTMQWSDPEYDTKKTEAIARAKAWYQHASDEQVATAAMEGFMAPFAYDEIARLSRQNAELRSQLDGRLRMQAPPVAPYYQSVPVVAPPAPPPKPGSPEQPWSRNQLTTPASDAAALISAMLR